MTGQQPDNATIEQDPSPYGPPSPLEGVAGSLSRPLTRGFALGLAALLLVVFLWVEHRQSTRLEQLELDISSVSSSIGFGQSDPSDPQTCWLLGVAANAQGKGDLVARWAANGMLTECKASASRGARGQALDGS